MTENVISFSDLGFAYRPGRWIFQGYSAAIPKGSVCAILGPNGRGKTTLLKLLLGALRPTAGSLIVQMRPAYVPQLFHLSFDYSVLDVVLMGRAAKVGLFSQPRRVDHDASITALERFGLADVAHRPFHELSGGQRQLAIFARALVAEAKILILDEPTSALDLKNQSIVLNWIATLAVADALTIILTTQHPDHALAVADIALLMMNKSRYAFGPAGNVLTEANLTSLYGVGLKHVSFEQDGKCFESFAPALRTRRHE